MDLISGGAMDAAFSEPIRHGHHQFWAGPWMLSSQNGLDHGRHHGRALFSLFPGRS